MLPGGWCCGTLRDAGAWSGSGEEVWERGDGCGLLGMGVGGWGNGDSLGVG
jgi:hypothetical protein